LISKASDFVAALGADSVEVVDLRMGNLGLLLAGGDVNLAKVSGGRSPAQPYRAARAHLLERLPRAASQAKPLPLLAVRAAESSRSSARSLRGLRRAEGPFNPGRSRHLNW
jgi:hypothetical protein